MNPLSVIDITREGLWVVLIVSLPVIGIALACSLLVAVVQAVTQIQDQTISSSVRVVVAMGTVLALAGWGGKQVMAFAQHALGVLPGLF